MREWSFTTWTETTPVAKSARAAVRNNFAVVFLHPGRKDPLCPLTARELQQAGPHHPCGVSHASTDEKWVMTVCRRLEKAHGRINLGIAAHASRVVVIDADTEAQVEAVQALLRDMGDDAALYGLQPTVSTPGVERDGVWVHHGGTHWYFNVVEGVELPMYPGELQLPGGAVMRWGNSYTVVPPSVRPEGRYESLADVIPDLPIGLLSLVRERVNRRVEWAAQAISVNLNDTLVSWSVMTPWASLLEPQGWQFLGKLDRQCGCPVWRRPGEGQTSDRSAIAHENDCQVRENREGHGSLHVFSDNVPGFIGEAVEDGQRDFTKLQFIAAVEFGGDETAAQVALSIESSPAERAWIEGLADVSSPRVPTHEVHATGDSSDQGFLGTPGTRESDPPVWRPELPITMREQVMSRAVVLQRDKLAREYLAWCEAGAGKGYIAVKVSDIDSTPAAATVARRADGVFMLYPGRVSSIYGPSDSGKSWYGLGQCHDVDLHGGEAMYIDIEDDDQGIKHRSDLLHYRMGNVTYVRPYSGFTEDLKDFILETARRCQLIVVDSLDAVLAMMGLDGNSNVAVRTAGNLFKQWAFAGGAAVLVIDHATEKLAAGEKATTAIGSSAKKALIDGVMLRADRESIWLPGKVCSTMVMVGKDRHGDVKQHAEFQSDQTTFGRLTRMRMTPGINPSFPPTLEFLVPPTYSEAPDEVIVSSREQQAFDARMLDALEKEWLSHTKLCAVAGDKNGRGGIGSRVDKFLEEYKDALVSRTRTRANRTYPEWMLPTKDPT